MKLTPSSTARRSTAKAAWRSLGGPQMPSPVSRMAPNPRRQTESSPPRSIIPAKFADISLVFMISSNLIPFDATYKTLGDKKLSHAADLLGWRSHKFWAHRMADILAENGVDRGEVALFQRPAAYFADSRKLIRAARPPQRDTSSGLVKEPADREVNHPLAKVFPGECIQL